MRGSAGERDKIVWKRSWITGEYLVSLFIADFCARQCAPPPPVQLSIRDATRNLYTLCFGVLLSIFMIPTCIYILFICQFVFLAKGVYGRGRLITSLIGVYNLLYISIKPEQVLREVYTGGHFDVNRQMTYFG